MLFLETSELPIENVIEIRRILYLQNILKRNEDELVRRVFCAMNNSPLKGDWSIQVYEDMRRIDICLNDEEISQMTKTDFKNIVKTKMRRHVLDDLNTIKMAHSKVMGIEHRNLKYPQKYLINSRFSNKQSSLLFNLRCKSQYEFASNFASSSQIITCKICKKNEDSQEHALHCDKLKKMHMTKEHR